jgi:hypothetical protein
MTINSRLFLTTSDDKKTIVDGYFNRSFLEPWAGSSEQLDCSYITANVESIEEDESSPHISGDVTFHDGTNTSVLSFFANSNREADVESLLERVNTLEGTIVDFATHVRRVIDALHVLERSKKEVE